MLNILIEEGYDSRDVLWCLGRLEKIRRLTPFERLKKGISEYRTGSLGAALPLLEEASALPTSTLGEWGYNKRSITAAITKCRTRLDIPKTRKAPIDRRVKKEKKDKKVKIASSQSKARSKAVSLKSKSTEVENRAVAQGKVEAPGPRIVPRLETSVVVGDASSIIESFESGQISSLANYFLALQAGKLSVANTYDNLIGLDGLCNVTRYAYQIETVRKVMRTFRGRVLLADEVGLGKTIEAGMVIREYMMRGMIKKALVLTPPSLVSQWCEELSSKFGLNPVPADGPELRRDPAAFWDEHDFIVSSLALARNNRHRPILTKMGFDIVVVDEAHRVKNSRTVGWKLVNELRSRFLLLVSATPVENNLMDLYNLVTLLKPGQFGTRAAFKREFVERGDATQARNRERLRTLVGEVMIRNTRALADIKLPPRHATTVMVEGEPSERELYTRLVDLVREGCRRKVSRLSLSLLLQQAGSSPRAVHKTLWKMSRHANVDSELGEKMTRLAKLCEYVPETAKTTRLCEIVKASQEKVLVFSRFTATLEELSERLSDARIKFCVFSGGMTNEQKDRAVEEFRDKSQVMLCSEIGGEGRNLQFCSTLVNYDLPWNPMKIEQRIGRIHRIGQSRPVHVYNLCAANTAEDHILKVLDKRINMFELVIGEMDLVIGQMKDESEFEERILSIYTESRSENDVTKAFDRLGDQLLKARNRYEKVRKLDSEIFSNDYEV
ncbi:MAG: DEAD/DEAH box helicase [Deltaproteobacteria bacterium]|nr:DEAD/DEAH box helicase [Deltaproteobacteria bacterium]